VWSRLVAAVLSLGLAGCADPTDPAIVRLNRPAFVFADGGGGIPNGGMEGVSASGTYTQWPPSGWILMFPSEGFGDKDQTCYTSGFCNSGTVRTRWGEDPNDPADLTTGLFAPPNPDPLSVNNTAFAILATQDVINSYNEDPTNKLRYIRKGAVKIPISVPATGRPILFFDWAFATAELNSGAAYNDVARIVLRRQGQPDVTLLQVSRNDLQPGGTGTSFTSIVRKNADGTPKSCGRVENIGGGAVPADYPLCTDWQRAQIDMTPYLGAVGLLVPSVEEVPLETDAGGNAFETTPRPSALALDNMRMHNATASLSEGVAGAVTVTFPALVGNESVISYTWNVPGCTVGGAQTNTATVTCPDDGNYLFSVDRKTTGAFVCTNFDNTTDTCLDFQDDEFKIYGLIQAANVAPVINTISGAPTTPVPVGTNVTITTAFTAGAPGDVNSARLTWDDGTSSTAGPPVATGFQASHTFTESGVYTVNVRVSDDDNSSDNKNAPNYIVVYDPNAGFVTGGGWIMSPAGAQPANPGATGKAQFGFSAKYAKNGAGPGGDTEFNFSAGNLFFTSTSYQWLVVAGTKAQFKGTGKINGGGNYGFLLSAIDGDADGGDGVDKFRIKIVNLANNALVYDNKIGEAEDSNAATAIGGGNIMVHTKK
jgi:hypothetical protein